MQNKNHYEVTGVIKQIRQYEGRKNLVVVGFVLEHNGPRKTEEFKMICFNKIAQYLLSANPVGHEVEITGHLQLDNKGTLTIIAHRITDLTLKNEKNPVDPFDSLKEDEVKVQKIEVKVQKIEMLDKKTNIGIKSFDSIKAAASYAAVKKSKIEHAIKNGKEAGGYYWRRVNC